MKSILIQVVAAIIIFNLVSMFKESSLLDVSGDLPAPYFSLPILENKEKKQEPKLSNSTSLNETYNKNNRLDLSQLKNQKTVVYFFAPWCSICKISMPNLQNKVSDGSVNAIAIALDFDNSEQVKEFTNNLGITFTVLLGNHQIRQNYQIEAYPTYYVIDENLKLSARSMGYSTELGLTLRGS
ncbi:MULTISPECIES: TlpA disulfide reductase family protein [unclassified Pseudoalteromonas]|uniref:TlpA disulfide reductase family protein n=1 Tax=unclassified Pseudoalteromonas TaxID=194690 RepID=UPI000693224C|nr:MULTISPECIES: TlpA disulfide reductase family protein [unclassified Pseudoalteromonas]